MFTFQLKLQRCIILTDIIKWGIMFNMIRYVPVVWILFAFNVGQDLGQCNLDGARDCLANVTIPHLGTKDLKEACQ